MPNGLNTNFSINPVDPAAQYLKATQVKNYLMQEQNAPLQRQLAQQRIKNELFKGQRARTEAEQKDELFKFQKKKAEFEIASAIGTAMEKIENLDNEEAANKVLQQAFPGENIKAYWQGPSQGLEITDVEGNKLDILAPKTEWPGIAQMLKNDFAFSDPVPGLEDAEQTLGVKITKGMALKARLKAGGKGHIKYTAAKDIGKETYKKEAAKRRAERDIKLPEDETKLKNRQQKANQRISKLEKFKKDLLTTGVIPDDQFGELQKRIAALMGKRQKDLSDEDKNDIIALWNAEIKELLKDASPDYRETYELRLGAPKTKKKRFVYRNGKLVEEGSK